ncbi:transposase [Mucinivorans hirudinis]|uniref:Transposase n=1 Tax=Mucinivorans hirudinis TaxID=1433126 RepID=A0A060R641_9BACT|nr:transposase [Mucinivorans hirudinis]
MTDLAFRCPHLASLQLFHFQHCKLTLQTKNEMIKSTFKILFYVKRNAVRKDGSMPIIARITIDGKIAQFSTKIEILPDLWSVDLGRALGQSRESKQVNALLDDIKASIHRIYHEMQRRDSVVTAEKVKNEFLGITEHHDTLLDLFRKHNDDVQKLIGISKSAATYQKYEVTRKHLQTFIESKYRLTDISLKEINHMFITDFEIYLLTTGRCSQNTTAKFMQFFKRIIIVAKNNGLIVGDPFANYKIRLKKVDRGYLSEEELGKIMKKKFSSERLENVRDIFIFSCFTGLAYIDVKNLTQENVRTSFDGNLWIMTKRQKTDTEVNVPLLKIPKMILEKYKGKLPNKKLLPILSNQKMNSYLKEIGNLCEINKNLTFHLARHTFATTTTLAKGVPIETVSKMLGHTNIETTQIYARITNNKISNDMRGLSEKFSGVEKIYKERNLSPKRKTGNE